MARLISPEAILSYPNLFAPRSVNDGEPKFSCTLIFPEGTDLAPLKQAAAEVLKEKYGDKTAGLLKAKKLKVPFRDDPDDVAGKGYPEGATFINVRTTRKPGIVSLIPDPETGKPMPITDEAMVYPGVVVKASLEPYAYDVSGNRGVTFGLGNIQIIRDGERLDGRAHAADEFDADEDAVADLSDLADEDMAAVGGGDDGDDLADLIN